MFPIAFVALVDVIYGSWIYNYLCTKVVSWNPANDEVNSIQYYVIKFVSDLLKVGGFLRVLRFPLPPQYNRIIVESGVKQP